MFDGGFWFINGCSRFVFFVVLYDVFIMFLIIKVEINKVFGCIEWKEMWGFWNKKNEDKEK